MRSSIVRSALLALFMVADAKSFLRRFWRMAADCCAGMYANDLVALKLELPGDDVAASVGGEGGEGGEGYRRR